MDQSIVENSQSTMELRKAADLSATRISKCPKPFSIESIISSNDNNKTVDIESDISSNYEKSTESNVFFPSNVSMAAAATLYNPWFHNYFMQQQKVAGNVLEMMQINGANQSTIKEKFTEIFANNPLAAGIENRVFRSSDHERNVPPTPTTPRSIEHYFGSIENIHEMHFNEMITGANPDYYKHLSSYGIHCINQTSDNYEKCKSQQNNGDELESGFHKITKLSSDYDRNTRNDDSGAEENPDDDVDSDCNSEISLDMSPDGDNNTQGIIFSLIINIDCYWL